jgi:hypothetical protein
MLTGIQTSFELPFENVSNRWVTISTPYELLDLLHRQTAQLARSRHLGKCIGGPGGMRSTISEW